MRIHHLDCATMCPRGAALLFGTHPPHLRHLVAHCLLIELPQDGLLLVDTGLGLQDVRRPKHLARPFRALGRPRLDEAQCAIRQVEALGFAAKDVRHIALTHLDVDHAGGLPDFPWARIHVLDRELAATQSTELRMRLRYHPHLWAHGPAWSHGVAGEPWYGFEGVRRLEGLPPEVLLVPLHGHTSGHAGVAVAQGGGGWLLHAGDAYFHRGEIYAGEPPCPAAWRAFQRLVQVDGPLRLQNQARLRELAATHDEVRVFCAHDAVELAQLRAARA
ncbi:MAG: MBL fold metallo-hydrolase [Proteobacteria bacterium]|nr:MAG: MBL fold metallo-hydrolase [Pseudomonadota bacterium]